MKKLLLAVLFGLCLPSVSLALQGDPAPLQRADFARGLELTPLTTDTVQTLLLPESVYRELVSANLNDLRVFNAAGHEVPFAVRSLMDAERIQHGSLDVPLFPIQSQVGEDLLIGDVSLQVKRSADGRVLEVVSRDLGAQGSASTERPIAAYILDLGMLDRPAIGLTLPIPEGIESFLERYTIEASDDLSTWRTLVPQSTLASLDRNGTRLVRTRVALPETSSPYLRLRWLDYGPKFELESATVELQSEAGLAARRTIRLTGTPRPEQDNAYDFPSPGPLPINRIQLSLPEPSTLIQAKVQVSQQADGPWRTILNERFFRTTADQATRNDPYTVSTQTAFFWGLAVDSQGGGLGAGMPELELEYYPHQLAFVASGEGPFTLVFGRAGAPENRLGWDVVTRDLLTEEQRVKLAHETVSVGPVFDLAGSSALVLPEEEEDPTKYILWAVLLVGVGVLGSISLKLVRSMS